MKLWMALLVVGAFAAGALYAHNKDLHAGCTAQVEYQNQTNEGEV